MRIVPFIIPKAFDYLQLIHIVCIHRACQFLDSNKGIIKGLEAYLHVTSFTCSMYSHLLHALAFLRSAFRLSIAAYTIIFSFTVALTLHYSLKPPPSLSIMVQMKVTLSNVQPVKAEWLWTYYKE